MAWVREELGFAYTASQIDQIGREIWEKAGERILTGARSYLVETSLEGEDARPARETNRELLRLAAAVQGILVAHSPKGGESLSDETLGVLDSWARASFGQPGIGWLHRVLRYLPSLEVRLRHAADAPAAKGPRPQEVRLRFVHELATIWFGVRGSWPGRTHDWKTQQDSGPFLEFVYACLEPIDPAATRGIDDVIRRVAGMGK